MNLYTALCVLLIGAGIFAAFYWATVPAKPAPASTQEQYAKQHFAELFCDKETTYDFMARDPDRIDVPLHDGCFAAHVQTPKAWGSLKEQVSSGPTDWVSVWCIGQPHPSQPQYVYNDLDPSFDNCHGEGGVFDFHLEGHGTMSFIRLSAANQQPANSSPVSGADSGANAGSEPRSPQPVPQGPQYKLTPTEPTSRSSEYSMVVQQCHRENDEIVCLGKTENNTDAATEIMLLRGTITDDEGNSFRVETSPHNTARLLPGVPLAVIFTAEDPHMNVKNITLEYFVHWRWPDPEHDLIFRDIPVQ